MASNNIITWIFLVILSSASCQNINETCITHLYEGVCQTIYFCPYALSLIVSGEQRALKRIACGFFKLDPTVCCPLNKDTIYIKNDVTSTYAPERTTRKIRSTTLSHRAPDVYEDKINTYKDIIVFDDHKYEAAATTPVFTTTTIRSIIVPTELPDVFPDRSICGQFRGFDKIYGGDITEIDEFPWLARIKRKTRFGSSFGCAGSLITDRYVITAAHCFNLDSTNDSVSVRLGEWNTQTEKDCDENECADDPVDIDVEKVIIFPSFNKADFTKSDIALLRLAKPVKFTDFIQPVCLPTTEYIKMNDYDFESAYETAGWGQTEIEDSSVIKRKVRLNAVPMDTCRVINNHIPETSAPHLICAGGRKGEDSCRGDSGGPLVKLVKENNRSNWFLIGITSFGAKNCGTGGFPGVYTRVTSYMGWIRQMTRP